MKKSTKALKEFHKDDERFQGNIKKLAQKGKDKPIKEEVHHKVKAGDRRRDVILFIDDLENTKDWPETQITATWIVGTHSRERLAKKNYFKRIKICAAILISIPILYILVINLFGI